ncbi:MAG: hypothetical protein OEX19_02640 [Gammaproteobacteria bacterium]|nr:hypothetical protein [Gammaproteobacteria bacterium]
MFKLLCYSCLIGLYSGAALCTTSEDVTQKEHLTVPLMQYDFISLSDQYIHSASAGLLLQRDWGSFIGLYTGNEFRDPVSYDFPNTYHSIDTLLDTQFGRHQYIGIFKSDSNKPLTGGLNPIQAGAVYGYELINNKHWQLVLGAGIAVGEFGVELANGDTLPVIPVPLIRANYQSQYFESKFEFLTGPNWSFTVGPNSHVRLTFDSRMDQMRDARDIIFETNLAYRFFDKGHEMGDFAGVSIGFKNDNLGAFKLGNEHYTESLEAHYYSLLVTLDLTLIKVSAGRAFGGRLLYREEIKESMGEGWFVSVQGLIPL